jgi:chromosome partitioning protein
MKRIAFVAVKGGTGRTTTAVHLAHGLALAGHRVALVDCDPRNGAAAVFGIEPGPGLAELLRAGTATAVEVRHGLHLIASGGTALAALEAGATTGSGFDLEPLFAVLDDFEFVLFDAAPWCGPLQRAVLQACSTWIVPFGADRLGLAALRSGLAELESVRTDATLIELLPTFHDPDVPFESTLEAALVEEFARFRSICRIRSSNAVRAAVSERGTIFESDPLSDSAWDHARLVEHVRGGTP